MVLGTAVKMSASVHKSSSMSHIFVVGVSEKKLENVGRYQDFLQGTLPCACIEVHV